jgi:hypothetical protein
MTRVAAVALLLLAGCSSGGGVRPQPPSSRTFVLTWTASIEAEDGSPVDDLTAYRVEYGPEQSFSQRVDLPATVQTYTVTVPAGAYAFRVIASSASRGESLASNVEVRTVP